ncbi:MAG TPA: methyltransferase domain-containing protein [Steroidobacteraceae bacterium]|nr:methyltransferase domain-containing protein [Steroidobacteraceae bacterium]
MNSDARLAPPVLYWEERARRFASQGEGLAAVCSYGMPTFHNRGIHLCQYLALRPWLRPAMGTRVLDVGCGVGRWSRLLAARGACVTGVDHSATMIAEATRRANAAGLSSRCRFLVQDLTELAAGDGFDLILSVTVLQHILEPAALRAAVERLAEHLSPTGTLLLLEAAPRRRTDSCDSAVFRARERSSYLELFAQCGLTVRSVRGVDPAPFRPWLLPYLYGLPAPLRLTALALTTALSLPVDVLFGRRAVGASWHAVFVLGRAQERHAY